MTGTEVHGFADEAAETGRLAKALGVAAGEIGLHRFPDGESLPTVPQGARRVILYRSLHHSDDRLVPLLLAADAYRRAGVERLVLVAPYLCYLRQDAVFKPGQPLSRDVIGRLLGEAFDRVVTVQAHLHRTPDLGAALGTAADNLSVAADLAALFAHGPERPLVVGPDVESRPWVEAAADRLGADWTTFDKVRHGDEDVRLTLGAAVDVKDRSVLLMDDVCSTGGTLAGAIALLVQAGATSVDVAVAHALFGPDVEARLRTAGARRIVSSYSVPHPTNALPLSGVLAAALRNEVSP